MPACLFCGTALPRLEGPQGDVRVAFDPRLGRLWQVCPACARWNLAAFEARWETIEACERRARSAPALLRTEHLALLHDDEGQLIRVGVPARIELADWRYSSRMDAFAGRSGRIGRVLATMPEGPAGGYDFYGTAYRIPEAWIGSPFIEDAAYLSTLFLAVPIAERCPSCAAPLFIHPAAFGDVRLQRSRDEPAAIVPCGLCGEDALLPLRELRPALRAGLALVSRKFRDPTQVQRAARPIERVGDAGEVLRRLCVRESSLGELPRAGRLALWMILDEWAEADALEDDWRTAETLASIADGELTSVPGFEAFRRRITGTEPRA